MGSKQFPAAAGMTTRERLLDLIARAPQQSLATLSETLGVSRSRISQLLAEEGYVWRPAPVRPEPPGVWVRPS